VSSESSRAGATECSPRRKPWVSRKEMQAPKGRKTGATPLRRDDPRAAWTAGAAVPTWALLRAGLS
jgi:hypothetical protein